VKDLHLFGEHEDPGTEVDGVPGKPAGCTLPVPALEHLHEGRHHPVADREAAYEPGHPFAVGRDKVLPEAPAADDVVHQRPPAPAPTGPADRGGDPGHRFPGPRRVDWGDGPRERELIAETLRHLVGEPRTADLAHQRGEEQLGPGAVVESHLPGDSHRDQRGAYRLLRREAEAEIRGDRQPGQQLSEPHPLLGDHLWQDGRAPDRYRGAEQGGTTTPDGHRPVPVAQ
jgi:hypothetical protein